MRYRYVIGMAALLVAAALGALHAMSPGHSKTIVGAYLVGTRGTAKHALFLGTTVTITHTVGVFVLGFITLFLSQYILPERLYPWLEMISGLLLIGIGVSLFGSRLRGALKCRSGQPGDYGEHTHEHQGVEHAEHEQSDHAAHLTAGHDQDGISGIVHSHGGVEHSHLPPSANGKAIGSRSLLAPGISGVCCPVPRRSS